MPCRVRPWALQSAGSINFYWLQSSRSDYAQGVTPLQRDHCLHTQNKGPTLQQGTGFFTQAVVAVCCGCCMHTTNFKVLHTFCFNAPRMYLADLNGMFSWALRHEFQFTNFLSSLMPIAANTRRKIKPYVELRKSKKSNWLKNASIQKDDCLGIHCPKSLSYSDND